MNNTVGARSPRQLFKTIGKIGDIVVRLDGTDPEHPAIVLDDNAQAERLAGLLCDPNRPLEIDWQDSDNPDGTIIRIPYTPVVDSRIADLINVLGRVYFGTPENVRAKVEL